MRSRRGMRRAPWTSLPRSRATPRTTQDVLGEVVNTLASESRCDRRSPAPRSPIPISPRPAGGSPNGFSPEDVQLYYEIGLRGRRDLALAPDPRLGLEMTVLRMLAFAPEAEWAAPQAVIRLRSGGAMPAAATAPARSQTRTGAAATLWCRNAWHGHGRPRRSGVADPAGLARPRGRVLNLSGSRGGACVELDPRRVRHAPAEASSSIPSMPRSARPVRAKRCAARSRRGVGASARARHRVGARRATRRRQTGRARDEAEPSSGGDPRDRGRPAGPNPVRDVRHACRSRPRATHRLTRGPGSAKRRPAPALGGGTRARTAPCEPAAPASPHRVPRSTKEGGVVRVASSISATHPRPARPEPFRQSQGQLRR